MKNEIGNYIFSQWKHNEGYESNWLRRITRQSKTQLICDVQRTLLLSDKYKKMYDAGREYMKGIYPKWAKRFRFKGIELVECLTNRHNTDGVRTTTLLNGDFSKLICPHKYEELFGVDIRPLFDENSTTIKQAKHTCSVYEKRGVAEDEFYTLEVETIEFDDDCYGSIAEHLNDLFKVPVFRVDDIWIRLNTIHDTSIYNSGIKYHINHHGDKSIITSDEDSENRTVTFWLFEDNVVFKVEDGIDTW